MKFDKRTAVVIGAATGIGAASVLRLLAEGAHVLAIDRNADGLAALAGRAGWGPQQLATAAADALSEPDLKRALGRVPADWAPIEVLVNAVGGSMIRGNSRCDLEDMATEDWDSLIEFNLKATFLACKLVIPVMKRQRHGSIVNVASISAHGRGRANTAYSAAKAGIIALTRKLSFELGPFNVRCNAIAPGLTLSERVIKDLAEQGPEAQARAEALIPLRRLGRPEEQANAICFLASQEASFITGITLDVAGGQ